MRKRIFGIFTFIVMMLSCICFSACSNKYDDFEFVVMYAFSADATEWINVDDGIILNYGGSEDSVQIENGNAKIFFKVDIANVKEKHIDDIIVSKDGGLTIVKENQVFSISIPITQMTTLKFYETNSGKETKLSLGAYPRIEELRIKPDALISSMFEGGDLELKNLRNIEPYPGETNQTGVVYSVVSDNGEIVNGSILRAKDNATGFNNIIRVKATSAHNEEISVEFDVVVLPTPQQTSVVFESSDVIVDNSNMILYAGSDYATSVLKVVKPETVLEIGGKTYTYSLNITIDGVPYDISAQGHNGLLISKNDNLATITAMNVNTDNIVKFEWVIEGFRMPTESPTSEYLTKEIVVKKRMLPETIKVNNAEIEKDLNDYLDIYATNGNDDYLGAKLKLEASPLDLKSNAVIYIENAYNLTLKYADGLVLQGFNGAYTVNSGDEIYFSFANQNVSHQKITLKVRKIPTYFEGEEMSLADSETFTTFEYTLNRKVTADSFVVLNNNDAALTENTLLAGKGRTTNFKLKVEHTMGILNSSTISLKSNKENVKFVNGLQEISLNNSSIIQLNDGSTTTFIVPLICSDLATDATIEVQAGNEEVGISTSFKVECVDTTQDGILELNSDDVNYYKNLTEQDLGSEPSENTIYLALIKEFQVDFEVSLKESGKGIKRVELVPVLETGFEEELLSYPPEGISNNKFYLTGNQNGTSLLDLNVYYYSFNEDTGVVELCKTTRRLEVAVCTAISSVYLNPKQNDIIYINSKYSEVSRKEISFNSLYDPSTSLSFKDKQVANVSALKLYVKNLSDTGLDQNAIITLVVGEENIELSVADLKQGLELENAAGEKVLNGKLVLKLNGPINTTEIEFVFVPTFLGNELTAEPATIACNSNYKAAKGIKFTDVQYNLITKDPEINASFLNVKQDEGIQVSFGASAYYEDNTTPHYDDLDVFVYKLTEDEDGEVVETIYEDFEISQNNGIITISALKKNNGGYFKIRVVSKDSYNDDTSKYATQEILYFRLTDGSKENPYILYNDTFKNINNDLNANYVLGETISLDNSFTSIGNGNEFNGTLSGTVETYDGVNSYISTQYAINVVIKQTSVFAGSVGNMVAGVFGVLGENAEIKDLRLNATFDTDEIAYTSSNGVVSIGALAGINRGKITNVGVELKSDITLKSTINQVAEVNLGGLVGLNEGTIDLQNSVVKSSEIKVLTNIAELQNIGLVVGRNNGAISGNYKSKEDLDEIVYSVIANFSVENSSISENNKYNISAVAGVNKGTISGIIVGGRINVDNKKDLQGNLVQGVKHANGYLAGIAGTNNGTISTNTILALDLTSNSGNVDVAGVAGENASEATITDARVLAVVMDFGSFETTGQIVGLGNVAGAVVKNAKSEDGTKLGLVEWVGVESFLSYVKDANGNISNFYLVKSVSTKADALTAGLICENAGNLKNSFINANLAGSTVHTTSNISGVSEQNTYFIGKVSGTAVSNATYSVVVNDDNLTFTQYGTLPTVDNTTWAIDENAATDKTKIEYNYVVINGTKEAFPYLVKEIKESEYDMFMINRPTDLKVWINTNYATKPGNVYVKPFNLGEYNIEETILVNYINVGSNNVELNTYKISYLISKEIIPTDENVQGGIRYEIVAGGNFARIEQDSEKGYSIVFLRVSLDDNGNPAPIVVRCYSIFNNDIDKYVVFFTELGVTELVLESSSIVERDNEQVISTYVGGSSIVVNFNSVNTKDNYKTILETENAENFLNVGFSAIDNESTELTITNIDGVKFDIGGILTINTNDWINSGIKISANENAPIEKIKEILLTVNLTLDLKKYSNYFNGIDGLETMVNLVSKTVRISVAESATDLDISVGGDAGTYQTNANIGFEIDIETSFKDNSVSGDYVIDENIIEKYNNVIRFNESNKDSVRIYFEVVEDEFDTVENLLSVNNCSIAELFDVFATYTPTIEGYKYHIEICLKDEMSYRYITNEFTLKVTFAADSNPRISDNVEITFIPTKVSTFRIENYSAKTINAYTQYTELITKSNSETSFISPGGNGGVMVIYMSPSYAYIDADTLKIISSYVNVPSRQDADKRVFITFEQLIYNSITDSYEKLYPTNSMIYENADNTGRIIGSELTLATYKDENENIHYNGILYIHTLLEKFTGVDDSVDVTFSAGIGNDEEKKVSKTLKTTYVPGAVLEYKGIKNENGNFYENIAIENNGINGYLIQNNTYNNVVNVKTYGYQFVQNPSISFEWNLNTANSGCSYFENENEKLANVVAISSQQELEAFDGDLYFINENGEYVLASTYVAGTTYFKIPNRSIIYKNGVPHSIYNYVNYKILTDYNSAVQNDDGSYTIQVGINIQKELISNFAFVASLTISNGHSVLTSSSKMNFFPTNYVLRNVEVQGVDENGVMNVPLNTAQLIELNFETNAINQDLTDAIYTNVLLKDLGLGLDLTEFNSEALKQMFKVGSSTFGSEFEQFDVDLVSFEEDDKIVNRLLNLRARNTFTGEITFAVGYGYNFVDGMIELQFVDDMDNAQYRRTFTFTLNIFPYTTEENAIPIYTAKEFVEKLTNGANADFILMNDIELTNYKPITTAIASLDGNNKVIKIKSFAINTDVSEYGLFGQLNTYVDKFGNTQKSILKNVVVDYSALEADSLHFTNNEMTNITFGGLVANNIGGLIYNCDVMNFSNKNKSISVLMDNDSSLTFGGLVGVNSGVITNSRVGRSEFTKVVYEDYKVTKRTSTYSGLTFVIGNSNPIINGVKVNKFDTTVGGFVGKNTGIISSSYVSNTSIVSHAEENDGKLAGFVGSNEAKGTNVGQISYSYVRASDSALTSTSVFNSGSRIESTTDSRVAGFVHSNAGVINNAFANIELKTTSKFVAGFVDNNSGRISECYAATTMNGVEGGSDISERPFIGVDDLIKVQNSNNGVIENSYYVVEKTSQIYSDELADGLTATGMNESKNLIGFVFVLSSSRTEREQGVWSYYTASGKKTILPELVGANQIAISARVSSETAIDENSNYIYDYVPGYDLGTKVNPMVIRNAEEFNSVFRPNGTKTESNYGFIRFIDNVDFSINNTSITTRANFTLGDDNYITSIEGNAMTIKGIYLDAESGEGVRSTGLFAEIKNSFVKNLKLEFINPITATSTSGIVSVGGLAGRIKDSAIINIDLSGDILLQGKNMVGGLAGIITGNSMLYGISSNVNAQVTVAEKELYSPTKINEENYSYAGAIAGIIDIDSFGKEENNIAYINVETKSTSAERKANILASFAGGVAGYAGKNTKTIHTKINYQNTSKIKGSQASGGIYGVSLGGIVASQVAKLPVEKEQYKTDKIIADYITTINQENSQLDVSQIGNTSLIESDDGYAGGLIGVSVGANIKECYAKVAFSNADVVGGLVGGLVGNVVNGEVEGSISYSYSVPVLLSTNYEYNSKEFNINKAGGLIGEVWERQNNQTLLDDCGNLLGYRKSASEVNVQSTFSTIILENKEVDTQDAIIDLLCSNYDANVIKSSSASLHNVYVGEVGAFVNDVYDKASSSSININLQQLLDVQNSNKQSEVFDEVFGKWGIVSKYWNLDNSLFYPILKEEDVTSYVEIYEDFDFNYLVQNPDLNYKVMEDINMYDWCNQHLGQNYVLPITFTGSLVGKADENGKLPRLYNLHLKASESDEGAGFFKETRTAFISGLTFEWNSSYNGSAAIETYNDVQLEVVGGVSAIDNEPDEYETEGSTLTSINVVAVDGNTNTSYLIKNENNQVQSFGGIIGIGVNTTLMDCKFDASVELNLNTDSGDTVFFGGIVAQGSSTDRKGLEDDIEKVENMKISNCGATIATTKANSAIQFNISVGNCKHAYVGGAFGSLSGVSASGIKVDIKENDALNVNIKSTSSIINIGGISGEVLTSGATSFILSNSKSSNIKVNGTTNQTISVGGLVGLAEGSKGEIKSNAVNNNIDLKGLSATTLYTSMGVAQSTVSQLDFVQNYLQGEINAESTGNLGTIYAGGAVGLISETINIEETLTNVAIIAGHSNTTNFIAGGLVGGQGDSGSTATVNILANVSMGRIVPITNNSSDTETYVGGFVGEAHTINAEKSYSLTSIITDSVGVKSVGESEYCVNALYGSCGTANNNNVFYSSDYALCTDTSSAINLSAGTIITKASSWATGLMSGSIDYFSYLETGVGKTLPYITTLRYALEENKLINTNDMTYAQGSALNPFINPASFQTDYTYYIASAQEGQSLSYSGKLNGILIGDDKEIIAPTSYESETSDESNNLTGRGMIPVVKKHSAVSNLHVKVLNTNNVKLCSDGSVFGVIVGVNEGVVFNCSISGKTISLVGDGSFGGIVGGNNGTVSSSFSTIEIKSTGNAKFVGGVVGQNGNGTIMSSYFTGYINNTKQVEEIITKAGGVVGVLEGTGYIYNCYSAGVITNISNGNNLLVGEDNASGTTGSNNFVDNYAGINTISSDGLKIAGKESAELMLNSGLKGNWEKQASELDEKLVLSGLNFGYPTINLNKRYPVGDSNELTSGDSTKYHEYTGVGNTTYTEIINNERGYEQALKVPHIGILNAIRKMPTNLAYVAIYDIDAKKNDWTAVPGFTGVFMSNKYLDKTKELVVISNFNKNGLFTGINNATIADLVFGGKFEITNSGVIGGEIASGETSNKTLVKNISFAENTMVWSSSSDPKDNYVGGLFGTISLDVELDGVNTENLLLYGAKSTVGVIAGKMAGGTLSISHVSNYDETQTDSLTTVKGYDIFNKGIVVNIGNEEIEGARVAGGLIGEMSGGTITGTSQKVSNIATSSAITLNLRNAFADNFGGIVGVVKGATDAGSKISINNIALKVANAELIVKNTTTDTTVKNYYGMIASNIESGTLAVNNLMMYQEGDTVQFKFLKGYGNETAYNENNVSQAVGGIVGRMNGNIELSVLLDEEDAVNYKKFIPTIESEFANLGGVAGLYLSGDVSILGFTNYGTSDSNRFILKGQTNVGGVFGNVANNIAVSEFVKVESQIEANNLGLNLTDLYYLEAVGSTEFKPNTDNSWEEGRTYYRISTDLPTNLKKLLTEKSISEVMVVGGEGELGGEKYHSNFGGLFGILKSNLPKFEGLTITNTNVITFNDDSSEQSVAYNIGGIAGKFVGSTTITVGSQKIEGIIPNVSNLLNTAKIGEDEIDAIMADFSNKSKAVNVGGIFGFVSGNSSIREMTNKANVSGYQNVGGYVGYYYSDNTETSASFSFVQPVDESGNAITNIQTNGVVNVGGVFGFLNNVNISGSTISDVNVNGNTNIGALAGLINTSNVSGLIINNANINAIYEVQEKESKKVSVIPTSVGGLCGQVVNSTLDRNTLRSIKITSALEGSSSLDAINTNSNLMHKTDNLSINALASTINDAVEVQFTEIKSGFGGFVGTMDKATLNKGIVDANLDGTIDSNEASVSNAIIRTNSLQAGPDGVLTIDATLGINVGAFYGYIETEFSAKLAGTNPILLTTPEIDAAGKEVNIDGGYNIGSVAGFVDSKLTSTDTSIMFYNSYGTTFINCNADTTVKLQENRVGMYVGGLFGKLYGTGFNLELDNSQNFKVEINTSRSYYMGGLVGRWEALDESPKFNGSVPHKVTSSEIDNISSAAEFGGLIGMAKMLYYDDNGGAATLNVSGVHYYPFTINTIENSNYADGESNFSATDDGTDVWLTANAYYVNLDSFTICATNNSNLYNKNPFNASAQGWHKTYTGFKAVQRAIPQTGTWDAVANVYDASNITHVEKFGDGNIRYTIYEESVGNALLYSIIGIATSTGGSSEEYIEAINKEYAEEDIEYEWVNIDESFTFGDYDAGEPEIYGLTLSNYLGDSNIAFKYDLLYRQESRPVDGSIFNVSGVYNDEYKYEEVDGWRIFQIIAAGLLFIAGLVGMAFTGGQSGWVSKYALMWLLVSVASTSLLSEGISNLMVSKTHLMSSYLTIQNKNLGYLTGGRSMPLNYVNGKMQYQMDNHLFINEDKDTHIYSYYSANRPADIYEHYFVSIPGNGSGYSYLSYDATTSSDNVYKYNIEGKDYVKKYIYKFGAYYVSGYAMKEELFDAQFFDKSNYTQAEYYDDGRFYTYEEEYKNYGETSVPQTFIRVNNTGSYLNEKYPNEASKDYNYVQGDIYYARTGNIAVSNIDSKYNKFIPINASDVSGKIDEDYIAVNWINNSGETEIIYFERDTEVPRESITEDTKIYNGETLNNDEANKDLIVVMNPYLELDTTKEHSIYNAVGAYFENSRNITSTNNSISVSLLRTYYYYAGGDYKVIDEKVFIPSGLESVELYNSSGEKVSVSNNFGDYYITDVKNEQYKASNVYCRDGEKIYVYNASYKIGNDGKLKHIVAYPDIQGDYGISWIQNAYLTNSNYNLYTRYKYTNADGSMSDLNVNWYGIYDPDGDSETYDEFVWFTDVSGRFFDEEGDEYDDVDGYNVYYENGTWYYFYYRNDDWFYDSGSGWFSQAISDSAKIQELEKARTGEDKRKGLEVKTHAKATEQHEFLCYARHYNMFPNGGVVNENRQTILVESLRVTLGGGTTLAALGGNINATSGTITIS